MDSFRRTDVNTGFTVYTHITVNLCLFILH